MRAPNACRPPLPFVVAALLACTQAAADECRQEYRDEAADIAVEVCERGDLPPRFRAVSHVQARLSAVLAVMLDTAELPRWVFRTREAKAIEGGGSAGTTFVVTGMPWPIADRESVVAWTVAQDAASGAVTIAAQPGRWAQPPARGRVRMTRFESSWTLRPREGGSVELVFEGWTDLGGNLNAWPLRAFVRDAVWQAPAYTMAGLRERVQLPGYRNAVIDFIREP